MGQAKRLQLRQQELGARVGVSDDGVCCECVADSYVAGWITAKASLDECTFCGRRGDSIAIEIDDLWELISIGLQQEWEHAEDHSQAVPRLLSYDVADAFDPPMFESEALRDAFIEAFQDWSFCERDPWGLNQDAAYIVGWERFSKHVRHTTRYLFLSEPGNVEGRHWSYDGLAVPEVLEALGNVCRDTGLFRQIPRSQPLYRVRVHAPSESYERASDLGTAPSEGHVHGNRMSPAGIPLFYGAFEAVVAFSETFEPARPDANRQAVTVAKFVPSRDLTMLDLNSLPPMPSICEEGSAPRRAEVRFLREFAQAISRPIAKDDRVHVDYVPTQIVCEYFRRVFQHEVKLDGLIYPSAKAAGHAAAVLFVDSEHCIDSIPSGKLDELWLSLEASRRFEPPVDVGQFPAAR